MNGNRVELNDRIHAWRTLKRSRYNEPIVVDKQFCLQIAEVLAPVPRRSMTKIITPAGIVRAKGYGIEMLERVAVSDSYVRQREYTRSRRFRVKEPPFFRSTCRRGRR